MGSPHLQVYILSVAEFSVHNPPWATWTTVAASISPHCDVARHVRVVDLTTLAKDSWLLPCAETPMGSPPSYHRTSGTGKPSATHVIFTVSPDWITRRSGSACLKRGGNGSFTEKSKKKTTENRDDCYSVQGNTSKYKRLKTIAFFFNMD